MPGLVERLAPHLPYARRYARSITGQASMGDQLVRRALEHLAAGEMRLDPELTPRVAFYRSLEQEILADPEAVAGARGAAARMRLDPVARRAFLLTSLEGFTLREAATILHVSLNAVERMLTTVQSALDLAAATKVLIVEDEPVIADDLVGLMNELGHEVAGVAQTSETALELARRTPDLGVVLMDVELADGSTGVRAAFEIMALRDVPVVFITAFPERLLTGERPEPTFLITKPFQPETVKVAVSQALFSHATMDRLREPPSDPTAPLEIKDVVRPPGAEAELTASWNGGRSQAGANVIVHSQRTTVDVLAPQTPALSVVVADGVAVLPSQAADTTYPTSSASALRVRLLVQVRRVAERRELDNHRALTDRLLALAATLEAPTDNTTALILTAQARSIGSAVDRALANELVGDPAADVAVLRGEIDDYVHAFRAVQEALASPASPPEINYQAGLALVSGAREIEALPDAAASPELKTTIQRIREAFQDGGSREAGAILALILAEFGRGVARWLTERAAGMAGEANKAIDKAGGKILSGALLGAIPVSLELLRVFYPQQFSFVPTLNKLIRIVIK